MFWLVFVDDLRPSMRSVKYADDTTGSEAITPTDCEILGNTPSAVSINLTTNTIQDALNYSQTWCEQHNMLLNAKKTNIINLSVKKNISTLNSCALDGMRIDTVPSAKLLGVTLDQHLTFTSHVQKKVRTAMKLIYSLVKRCRVSSASLVKLYSSKI